VWRKIYWLIKTSRPLGWIIVPLVFLLGFTAYHTELSLLPIVQLSLLSFPYCLLLYGINDVYDYESDRINPRKQISNRVLCESEYFPLVKKTSFIVAVLLISSSIITLNLLNIAAMLLLLFFSHQYSAPPLRLKERPPLDSFSNCIFYWYAPILIGASYYATIFDIYITVYFIMACLMGIHSFSTILDYSVDKMAGDRTFAVVFGKRSASLFAAITFIVSYFFSGYQRTVVGIYMLFCAMLSIIITIYPSEKWAARFFYSMGAAFIIVGILEVQRYIILNG